LANGSFLTWQTDNWQTGNRQTDCWSIDIWSKTVASLTAQLANGKGLTDISHWLNDSWSSDNWSNGTNGNGMTDRTIGQLTVDQLIFDQIDRTTNNDCHTDTFVRRIVLMVCLQIEFYNTFPRYF